VNVHLEPWEAGDEPLLHKLLGDPAMMEHLGGAESAEQIADRHQRYLRLNDGERMFKIVNDDGEPVGSVGYWNKSHHDQHVYETGWFVLPAFQGQGIAAAATKQAIERAAAEQRNRFMHAFPNVTNPASNAICRKLGFELVEEAMEFEYPKGHLMRCNDWRIDLFAGADGTDLGGERV
jgi:RimJ/RimL family protein N-acetyltransferase